MNKIVLPFKRWWNYHIRGMYLEDNMRNQALLNYLIKIINDPTYQPSGAYENSFEDRLKECHNEVITNIRAGKYHNIPIDIEVPYDQNRREYAIEIYNMMIEVPMVKEN